MPRGGDVRRLGRRAGMFASALLLVAALWELYKWLGPEEGGGVFGWRILPRTSDQAMPHVWEMLSRFARPERRGSSGSILLVVLSGAWFSLRLALAGFVMGTLVGLGLAVLMARLKVVERGLLPYLVISQCVPLIALAPLVVSWGRQAPPGLVRLAPVAVGPSRYAIRYAYCMTEQIAVRIPDTLAEALDDLVAGGRFETKADAVRRALEVLVEAERRRRVGESIVDGYLRVPQDDDEVAAATRAAIRSIHEEPW